MGEEGFIEKFKDLLKDKREVKEIPRPQRYVTRPSLYKIFRIQEAKGQRERNINAAHMSYGYTLKEIADYFGIRYSAVGKVTGKVGPRKK